MREWSEVARYSPDAGGLPVLGSFDVVVVGAGAAGVAAATVAAEGGADVLLVEKYGFCGGAAVAGLSGTICGLYLSTENPAEAEQVVFGFSERFRERLHARGGLTRPQLYGKTFAVTHDPLVWRETADEFLAGAGVRVLFHTGMTGAVMDGETITGVVLESNAGRSVARASRVVDASGDAAVVARAGYRYWYGDNGMIQNPTMFFRLGNVDLARFQEYWGADTISPPQVTQALVDAEAAGSDLPRKKIWIFPSPRPGQLMVNATRLAGEDGRVLNVIDPADFTEAEVKGRRQVREYARFLREHVPGCGESYVIDTGVEAGIRQTRTIAGIETLTNEDVASCRKRDDGICRSPWPIELHSGDRPRLTWLLDDYYDVPYGSLVPEQGAGLIVAGRCLSAQHEALASARVTAQCFEYGNAAAEATLLSLADARDYRDISGQEVAGRMRSTGSAL